MDNTPFSRFSADEQAYAISQLDPFHDQAYKLNGAPSDQSAGSVVLTINQEMVVDASDFGLSTASGGKWDLHVSALPITKSLRAYDTYLAESGGLQAAASTGTESIFKLLYPFTLSANNSGSPTFCDTATSIPFLGIDSSVTSFVSEPSLGVVIPRAIRVIASAFEVVDESPTLYQQGACTVYSRNSNQSSNQLYTVLCTITGAAANSSTALYTNSFSGPPTRIEYATILPNSKTWKASEGAYVIARKNVDSVPFVRPGIANLLMLNPTDTVAPTQKNCYIGREAINAVRSPATSAYQNAFCAVTPYNVSGAYLTGLNSEFGTYRIRTKISFEIIPDPTDTSLITQSTPTLPRNPAFEALLDETIHRLPPGVPQTMNPAGEWWKVVKRVSGSALKFLAPSIAVVNPALGLAAGIVGEELTRKKKKKGKEKETSNKNHATVGNKGKQRA